MKLRRQRLLALGQGGYYLVTGIWPLVSMATFLQVTGPKDDLWLVKTVGVLLLVNGGVLLSAGIREKIGLESFVLAVGDATGLAIIEIVYVLEGRIPAIYLLDAVIEIALILAWFSTLRGYTGKAVNPAG